MEITSYQRGTVAVVAVSGELDTMTADALRARIIGTGASELVLDLSQVTFIDSAGIRLLIATFVTRSVRPGRLAIAGMSEQVEHVLTVLGMSARLPVHGSIESAISAVGAETFAG
ncbi:STAS domain-containing protein [Herbidospora galbida]|uniref:Anti-sigma factor antagonist n=1 Tax=Herbidospora galbida TaxID=2575442 RepID=A0A4U3MNE3_9ACTN|nr:STAS domain-containing protein [Herbidospora galbida]TKK90369.1 STAS domain-containing protein [Herbidospora galbida]